MAGKWSSRDVRGHLPLFGMTILYILLVSVTAAAQEDGGDTEKSSSSSKLAVIEYYAPNLYPEGFDWDAKHKRFVVGSVSQGKLVTVTEQGVVEDFVKEDEAYAGAIILGVTVDRRHNRVLAVVHRLIGEPLNALVAYDLDSKRRLLFSVLPIGDESNEKEEDKDKDKKKFRANDVAVDSQGNAYVTNSAGNSIWKVTIQGVSTVLVDSLPELPIKSEMEEAKTSYANGIVVHPDGYLLVSQSNSGALLMIDLDDLQVQVVKVTDEKGGVVMLGADGLALRPDRSLVVVSVHTAWLVSSRDWRSARVVDRVPLHEEDFTTSAAVHEEGRVFTLQYHGFEFARGDNRNHFTIVEIEFPADPDNNPLWLLMIPVMFAVLILCWKCQLDNFNKNYTKKHLDNFNKKYNKKQM